MTVISEMRCCWKKTRMISGLKMLQVVVQVQQGNSADEVEIISEWFLPLF